MTYRIAVGTLDGLTITEHFGRCRIFSLYDVSQENDEITSVGERRLATERATEACGAHDHDGMRAKIEALSDCHIVLCAQIGHQAEKQLTLGGVVALQYQGALEDALRQVQKAFRRRALAKRGEAT